jgi:hypothetical protein
VEITQKQLKEVVNYNEKTGVFTWVVDMSIRARAGYVTGSKRSDGYLDIHIRGFSHKAHRLAWLYVYGEMPEYIDHIDGSKDNNRISNLRSVSHAENMKNRKLNKNNKSGFAGVEIEIRKNGEVKYKACGSIKGKTTFLGLFANIDDAIACRKEFELKNNYHKNHGERK